MAKTAAPKKKSKKDGKKGDKQKGGGDLIPNLVAAAAASIAAIGVARQPQPDPAAVAAAAEAAAAQVTAPVPLPDVAPAKFSKRILWQVDRFQRTRPWAAFPLGVIKKFVEDKAGLLAALVAYFGFLSIFPLIMAFTAVVGFVAESRPSVRDALEGDAWDQIPVVGTTISDNAQSIEGSGIALVVGVLVSLWAGLKVVDAIQNAMNDVWDIPRTERPTLFKRRARGLIMLLLLAVGLIGGFAVNALASQLPDFPGVGQFFILAGTVALNIGVYLVAYQVLTDRPLAWGDLLPGAIVGGVCWWGLQTFGSLWIANQLKNAGDTYGDIAPVITLLAFFFIAAQLSILAAEINVVRAWKLWPRSLLEGHFTDADLVAYQHLADSTKQVAGYDIRVTPEATTPSA